MIITFAGAAQEVTGSCYHIQSKAGSFLVDCGLFQGSRFAAEENSESFPFDVKKVDFVLLTHAHLDHCGRLPLLYERGFNGKIYCTDPTAQLTMIVLEDAERIMAESAEDEGTQPLYTQEHIAAVRNHFQRYPYHQTFEPLPGIKIEFFDAGHILGSSFIQIDLEGKRTVFSGDLGNPPVDILKATENFDQADFVVMESTYGGQIHENRALSEEKFFQTIQSVVAKKGTLLLPSFAIERTQEILYYLDGLSYQNKLPRFPIFLDSPMAIRATQAFRKYPNFYNRQALIRIAHNEDLFDFPGLILTETKNSSKMINDYPPPKMIIAGSGMMHGGRIRHHLLRYLDQITTGLVIIGYQVPGTLGRQVRDGAKMVKILGHTVKIKASITLIEGFSAHADQPKLIAWVRGGQKKPEAVFITHGEINNQLTLSEKIEQNLKITAHIPKFGEKIEL